MLKEITYRLAAENGRKEGSEAAKNDLAAFTHPSGERSPLFEHA